MSAEGTGNDARHWPRPGVGTAVFRDGHVLLIERGKGAFAGQWSLPGGHIEPGETALAAALREVREETGVEARIVGLVDVHDVIVRAAANELAAHYVLAIFAADWIAGEPRAASDAAAAAFVPLCQLDRLDMTPGAQAIIARAAALHDTSRMPPHSARQ